MIVENSKEGTVIRLDNEENEFIEKFFNRYGFSFKKMKKIKYEGKLPLSKILNNTIALNYIDKMMNGGDKLETILKKCEIEGFKNESNNGKNDGADVENIEQ